MNGLKREKKATSLLVKMPLGGGMGNYATRGNGPTDRQKGAKKIPSGSHKKKEDVGGGEHPPNWVEGKDRKGPLKKRS